MLPGFVAGRLTHLQLLPCADRANKPYILNQARLEVEQRSKENDKICGRQLQVLLSSHNEGFSSS